MILILLGLVGVVLSGILTKRRFNQSGLPSELLEHTAGKGLVPAWVSALNILSWIVLGIGVVSVIF